MKLAALLLVSSMSALNSPRAVVEELFRAFNRHDVPALQALYAPGAPVFAHFPTSAMRSSR